MWRVRILGSGSAGSESAGVKVLGVRVLGVRVLGVRKLRVRKLVVEMSGVFHSSLHMGARSADGGRISSKRTAASTHHSKGAGSVRS
jgi:hypothetical protein